MNAWTDSAMRAAMAADDTSSRAESPCCSHCGLAVPRGLLRPARTEQFCCHGCETAWELIHGSGLEAWYRLAADRRAVAEDPEADERARGFDSPAFIERFSVPAADGVREIRLSVGGIHCAACIWLIERLGRVCPGIVRSTVDFSRRTVTVQWRTDQVRLSAVARALQRLGYPALPVTPGSPDAAANNENRQQLVRLGIAGAAAGNNMLIATALYLGLFQGMEAGHLWLLRMASCAVGLVSLLWPGRVFFRGALASLRTRTPHVDLPLALGLGAGGVWGTYNAVMGRGEIYFDSISMLVFLLLVGRYIQFRQQRRAADAIGLLYRMTPPFAWKVGSDGVERVPAELLGAGDRVEVRAGETVPADGVIIRGQSHFDEAILSGESRPVPRRMGDSVSAGTINASSPVEVQVTAAGEETRLAAVLQMVQRAAADRPAVVQWADRMGGWFVVVVMAIALVTLAAWWSIGSPEAVDHMVALLVVACPCALAMSTPLTLSVAIGRAAARGIMIKGGDVMARLARPGRIWLDKTGTLTAGQMRVVAWQGDPAWRPQVAALEAHSNHPVAHAFAVDEIRSPGQSGESLAVADVRQVTGEGIEGRVGEHWIRVGRPGFAVQGGQESMDVWVRQGERLASRGLSPVYISVDGRPVAIAGVGDPIRPEAAGLVRELADRGWQVGILSGDHPAIVAGVARELGIPEAECHGGLGPEEKVAWVQRDRSGRGTVVMVGDGVNDSPALAAADVGLAVHSGAQASLQAAPVWLARSGIGEIASLLDASQRVKQTIRVAVGVSLGYNVLAIGLAAFGLIHPLLAAALMPISSLSVVGLAVGSRTFASARSPG